MSAKLDSVEQNLLERDKMLSILKSNLSLAQNKMKVQTDKHRTKMEFAVGDLAYLKLVPYQLQSLNPHSHHKLLPRFYGPFEVLQRVGKVAYKLKLPATPKIHHVFHVSCLKKHLGPQVIHFLFLPKIRDDGVRMGNPIDVLS